MGTGNAQQTFSVIIQNRMPCPANPSTYYTHAVYPLLETSTIITGYSGERMCQATSKPAAVASSIIA